MVDVGDILEAVRASGFETDQDERSLIFLNAEQRALIADHRWRFMLVTSTAATVANQADYTLPTSPPIMHLESIRLSTPGDQQLPELEWTDSEHILALAAVDPSLHAMVQPYLWSDIDPATIKLYPTPISPGTLTIRYLRTVVDLVDPTDIPMVPTEYLDVLRAGVCSQLAARERDWMAADKFRAEADARTAAMKGQYGLRQRQNAHRVAQSGRYTNDPAYRSF